MLAILLTTLVACDREGGLYVPQPNPDYPFIQDLGEFRVISTEEQEAHVANKEFRSWDEELTAVDDQGRKGIYYGGVGAPADASFYGGATFTFTGTGTDVCVVMDPEAVFWNQAQAGDVTTSDYLYVDAIAPDGDLDLDVGLTAYYTGSPGVEMGGFGSVYTDAGGVDHSLEASECGQLGSQGTPAHAGRSTVEYCTIRTDGRAGVSFTAVLDTFLIPQEDDVLHFSAAVFEGTCAGIPAGESGLGDCVLSREAGGALDLSEEETSEEYCENPDEPWNFVCLERAFCDKTKKLNAYCEDHFEDDNAPCVDNGIHPPADDADADVGI